MSIIREKTHSSQFVILYKQVLNDPNLSLKAKGLWAYLMGLPDDWKINAIEVANHSTDGKSAVYSGLQELVDNGYATKKQEKINGRYQEGSWLIHEIKKIFPNSDFRIAENPLAEKERVIRNNEISNEFEEDLKSLPTAKHKKKQKDQMKEQETQKEMLFFRGKYKPIGIPKEDLYKYFKDQGFSEDQITWAIDETQKKSKPLSGEVYSYIQAVLKNASSKAKEKKYHEKQTKGVKQTVSSKEQIQKDYEEMMERLKKQQEPK